MLIKERSSLSIALQIYKHFGMCETIEWPSLEPGTAINEIPKRKLKSRSNPLEMISLLSVVYCLVE